MTRFQNPTDGISQEALAGLVAEAVQQALMQHGIVLDAQALVAASAIAGSVAAALPFLPQSQRLAIGSFKGEWTPLAAEFLRTTADRIAHGTVDAGGADKATTAEATRPATQHLSEQIPDLQSMLIEDWAGEVAGSTYLEENFRIPRSTLHRWQRRGEVVALRKGGRKHVFPLAQFVDGRPAQGISEVLSAIANPRLAWFWLTRPSAELNGRVPIEMLRQDIVEDVVRVARGFPPKLTSRAGISCLQFSQIFNQLTKCHKIVIFAHIARLSDQISESFVQNVPYVPFFQICDVIFTQQDFSKSRKAAFQTQSLLCVAVN